MIDCWAQGTEDVLRLESKRHDKRHKWAKSDSHLLRCVKCRPCSLVVMEEVRSAARCWEDVQSAESEQVSDIRRSIDVKCSVMKRRWTRIQIPVPFYCCSVSMCPLPHTPTRVSSLSSTSSAYMYTDSLDWLSLPIRISLSPSLPSISIHTWPQDLNAGTSG